MILPKHHKNAIRLFEYKNTNELISQTFKFDPRGRYRAETFYARIGLVQLFIETGKEIRIKHIITCIHYVDCIFDDYTFLSKHPEYKQGLLESKKQLQDILDTLPNIDDVDENRLIAPLNLPKGEKLKARTKL